ncbi:MAG TPA: serine/threonine-protein kinase, partial [Thermoanaerobaculia bacterium]
MLASGTRLGPYEILHSVGAGGMGQVFAGRDTRLDRSVAIKVLPPHLSSNPDFKLRFDREARVISGLNHSNICTLYDVGETKVDGDSDPVSYLVMEFCDGQSLAERLARGPLPIDQVLRHGTQVAAALDRAHRAGIVHRDLKPGNIMLTKSGAKLLDFGLAKPSAILGSGVHEAPSADDATQHKALTAEGAIVGTFQYMAPEQLEGREADARTDLFALGAVLFEMATGRRAFEGASKTSLIAAIVSSHPAPISSVMPVPPALDHVVRKCLEKDPDDRWQSAYDIAAELGWISEAGSQAGVATPVARRRLARERLAWTLVALLGAATALL